MPDSPRNLPIVRGTEDFPVFYRREFGSVLGLAYVLSGSRSAAEELAQEAFTAAFRQWARVSRLDKPEAWVRRVVANQSVSRFRRLAAEARAMFRVTHEPIVPVYQEDTTELWLEVRRLPRRQAQAVALRYLEDLPIADVAEILDCSVETVRTHLSRASQKLAKRLEP